MSTTLYVTYLENKILWVTPGGDPPSDRVIHGVLVISLSESEFESGSECNSDAMLCIESSRSPNGGDSDPQSLNLRV